MHRTVCAVVYEPMLRIVSGFNLTAISGNGTLSPAPARRTHNRLHRFAGRRTFTSSGTWVTGLEIEQEAQTLTAAGSDMTPSPQSVQSRSDARKRKAEWKRTQEVSNIFLITHRLSIGQHTTNNSD